MIRKVCYKTSRDYKRLRELLDNGYDVVCMTTYNYFRPSKDMEPYMVTDVCIARKIRGCYDFSSRGQGYGEYDPNFHKFTFEDFCRKCLDLEYIEPKILKND